MSEQKDKQLTGKQEHAAQLKAAGAEQSEAYRIAYEVGPDTKPETTWSDASRLFSLPHVIARVAELKAQLSERALWRREDSVRELKEAIVIAKQEASAQSITGAVKELNLMHGYNEPVKVDLTGVVNMVHSSAPELTKEEWLAAHGLGATVNQAEEK